jgi:hypothetical protein
MKLHSAVSQKAVIFTFLDEHKGQCDMKNHKKKFENLKSTHSQISST